MKTAETVTPYEALGGEVGIRRLVHRFYELMDELPEAYTVRQIHPESLDGSATSLFEFLSGWFAPYAVGPVVRDEWMLCMTQALTEQVADPTFRDRLIETFAQMANHLINTDGTH